MRYAGEDIDVHHAAEGRRAAAVGRFLATAIDPAIDRRELLAALAREVADTIGDFCMIMEPADGGTFQIAAVAGGPGDVAARIRAANAGRSISVPADIPLAPGRDALFDDRTAFVPALSPEMKQRLAESMRTLGLPSVLATTATSTITAPILSHGAAVGRIYIQRFGDDPAYVADDVDAVQAIAAAASLVLERRNVEDELAGSLAVVEALFDQAPVPLGFIKPDGSARWNTAMLELFDRTAAEMGASALRLDAPYIPADDANAWVDMLRRVSAGESIRSYRLAILRPSGERREVEASCIVIRGPAQAFGGRIMVVNDVTDLLSIQAQLRHAQKMEALGRLAGGIAHDFNNILMAILGFAEFVAEAARAGRASAEDAEQVVVASRRAIELTSRLTSFARREAARRELIDPADAIDAMLPLIRRLAPESIEIVVDLQPTPTVLIDRVELEQILVNLVVNAVDAMPQGGRLLIETQKVRLDDDHAASKLAAHPGEHAMIVVTDTGMGMDAETRGRIFEPFFTTKDVGKGTGLGLANAFAAVERAGGRIAVYSELGRGTTFRIYLPRSGGVEGPDPERPESSLETRGSESILLVEDDDLVRDFVGKALRSRGYSVTVATGPAQAIDLARTQSFDLLVSDVVMPGVQGDSVAAAIRSNQPDLAVIYMSGYTARALDFTVGPRETLLYKPLSSIELGRAVRTALDGR